MRTALVGLVLLALVAAACGDDDTGANGDLTIVATTTILGDVVSNVVGDNAEVTVLMPEGVDPHDFRASASQVALLNDADLVVANGLGLEEGLIDVLEAARDDGVRVITLAEDLDPLPFGSHEDEEGHEDEDGHDHEGGDPHVWLDPLRMADAAALIAEALTEIDPDIDWAAAADVFAAELRTADSRIIEILAGVPDNRRLLVTNHDALGYFADRYGFEVIATIIPGGSTIAGASSEALADLVRMIQETDVPAIFADATGSTGLADAIASEVERDVQVVELFTGSISEADTGAATLIGLLTENATRIAAALGS